MNPSQIAALGAATYCLGICTTVRLLAWLSARFRHDPVEQWLFGLATLIPFTLALAFSLLAVLVYG